MNQYFLSISLSLLYRIMGMIIVKRATKISYFSYLGMSETSLESGSVKFCNGMMGVGLTHNSYNQWNMFLSGCGGGG